MKRVLVTMAALALAIPALTGCEDPRTYRPVTGAELRTYNVNTGDFYAELAVLLKTDQVELPEIAMPVTDARRPGVNLANLAIRPAQGKPGFSEMLVAVNVTRTAGLEGAQPVLPNGSVLPISGVDMRQLVALPLDQFNQNGRIYLAIDTANGTAIMGAALTWPVLDNFGRNVGPVNFFPGFNITDGVRGIAGIFASHYPNQNGVAVFADVSEWLKNSRRGTYQPSVDGQVIFLK